MAEIIETRSRSRSKTPGPLLMAENGDSNKKGSKIPTISLIEEEDDVVEVVPMSQPTRPKRPRRNAKVTTTIVDTSSDVSVESPKNSQSVSKTVVSTTTVTETVTKTTNGSEESSSHEQATTTNTVTKSSIDAPENQSIFNNIFNAIKTSTPILSNKRSKRITQDITEINVADHPAYKEYKEAGEYWNKYPKTDYTYSELSPHRRELSNGVVAMPNMSRRSLEKYTTRVEAMIQNNPADETFLRRKFLANTSSTNSSFQKRSADLQYDSADEVDVSELRKQLQARRKPAANNVVSRFFLAVVSYFYSVYYSSKQTVRRIFYKNESYAYTPVRRSSAYKQGIFLQSFEAVKRFILLGFSKVYLFVSTILCLDTWILYTRSDNQIENRKRKRFLLGLLVLLPLLLLGGTYIYLDPPQNLSFPKITLPKLSFPKISLPTITLPTLSFPKISFSWPSWLTFSLPTFSMPEISFEWFKFSWPAWLTFSLSWPAWLKFPEFNFSWPDWSMPTISFAWLTWPTWLTFSWPSFSLPSFSLSWPSWLTFTLSWPSWLTFSLSWPAWLKFPTFSLPEFSLPTINWPTISLPSLPKFSLPSFSFDVSPVTDFIGDKFGAFKSSTFEFFAKISEVFFGLINEAQIVWSENFNAVANSNNEIPVSTVNSEVPVVTSNEIPTSDFI